MMIASRLHNPLSCPPLRLLSPFSLRNLHNLACSSMSGCRRVGLPLSLPSAADSCKVLARHFSAPFSLRLTNLRQDLIHARDSDASAVATSKGALRCSLISSFASGWTTFKEGIAASASDVSSGINEVKIISELEQALGTPFDVGPQVAPPKPLVIVISGPSGVGKDAVIKRLQEVRKEIHFVVTATTRPKRPGEVDGVDYFFVSKEEFKNMIDKNELLEHALVYGDYKGIPKKQMRQCLAAGKDVVLRVDVQGAATVRSILGSNAVFIFIVAESEFALVKRLVERKTETMEKLLVRIATARDELQRLENFEYAVVNADGQLEKAVNAVCGIIDAEKARVLQKVANI